MGKKYDGESIDMSWQTAPWNNDGETIDAYDSDGDGEIMTIDWPENATEPEKLTENQRRLITTAARYPSVDDRARLIELSGLDMSSNYPNYTLRRHWPERYWGDTDQNHVNKAEEQTDRADTEKPRSKVDTSTGELRRRALNGETASELANDHSVTDKAIRKRLKGEQGFGKCSDVPPLEYEPGNGWKIAEQVEHDPEAETDRVTEDTETHSVTPGPVQHTPEPESSSVPAWVWAVAGAVFAWIVSKILG